MPLPSVRVDVIGRGEVLEVVVTSTDGMAVLSEERWDEVRRISISHVGYATRLVSVEDLTPDTDIYLEPNATPIEGFVVDAEALCPVADDPDARALWEAVASNYSAATGERALSARMTRSSGPIRSDELHRWVAPDNPIVVFGRGEGVDTSNKWARGGSRVARDGYAWEPVFVGGIGSARFLNWEYLDLHHDEAAHLVTEAFGDLHSFSLAGERGGETTLVFCPVQDGPEANIRGTLVVTSDVSLLRADWRFDTPRDDEGAGGWAEFASVYSPTDPLPHLVPARGAYFRHDGTEPEYPELPRTYLREVVVYQEWFVHGGPEHPCKKDQGRGYNIYSETPESDFGKDFVACVGRFIPPR